MSPAPQDPIRIDLEPEAGDSQPFDHAPSFSVRVTNVSDQPLWMIGVLPGSEGIRYPHYRAEIEGPSGVIQTRLPESLDYSRSLTVDDFVRLDPGESFDPEHGKRFVPIQELAWFKPSEPGRYRLRVRLDATAQDPRQWMGDSLVRSQRQVERLLHRVPRLEVHSNTVEIEFH